MYNSDHDEINDVGEGDGEGGEVGGAGGEGRDTATGIRTVSGDDDPSSDQWWTTIENHRCFQPFHSMVTACRKLSKYFVFFHHGPLILVIMILLNATYCIYSIVTMNRRH